MLHEALADYLVQVERQVLELTDLNVDHYVHEVLTHNRINIRFRLRTNRGHLLDVSEALGIESDALTFLDYRYHFQGPDNQMIFRYDNSPHHPHLSSFPNHKHERDTLTASFKPSLDRVIQEAIEVLSQ